MGFISLAILVSGLVTLSTAQYNYGQVLGESLLFFEAQRTGPLPPTNRIPWRGDTFVTDQGQGGVPLAGGYFDAGDHVKFGLPQTSAIAFMAWGLLDSNEGYVGSGELANGLAALRWGTDYLLRTVQTPNVLYVQVGNGNEDHSFWGRPEQWTGSNPRPVLRATTALPASEVAAGTAAALAASSLVFRLFGGDVPYANTLLTNAEQIYTFATTFRGHYNNSFPEVIDYYNSWSGYGDEFLWAAAWLSRASGNAFYQTQYNTFWTEFGLASRPSEVSWDNKQAAAQILLAAHDGAPQFVTAATNFCNWFFNEAQRTPLGLIWLSQWGSLRHMSNAVFVCLQAANAGINPAFYREQSRIQIDYALGSTGRSFVVGFGVNPPQRPHHTSSSCPNLPAVCNWDNFHSPAPNPQVLRGALVGGPDQNDNWADDRSDYITNEVTIDYNAGFQGAVAELSKYF